MLIVHFVAAWPPKVRQVRQEVLELLYYFLAVPFKKSHWFQFSHNEVENGRDKQDVVVNGGTESSDSVSTWSTSSSHPVLIPNQSGTCGPQLKADKQNFAPVVALWPASRSSLSSVFTRHLSITCNLPPFHARLQNQLVCVTFGSRVSPQLSKLMCDNNKGKSLQVRGANVSDDWESIISERYFLFSLSSPSEFAPSRKQPRAQSLSEFIWEEQMLNDPGEAVHFLQHYPTDVVCTWKSCSLIGCLALRR